MVTNRKFGLVFFAVFLIISLFPLLYDLSNNIRIWALVISLIFLLLGILDSKLLTPLNKLWMKLGAVLGIVVAPIVMGIIFFAVVTPIGIFMRIFKKDLLQIKIDKNIKSYWQDANKRVGNIKNQF